MKRLHFCLPILLISFILNCVPPVSEEYYDDISGPAGIRVRVGIVEGTKAVLFTTNGEVRIRDESGAVVRSLTAGDWEAGVRKGIPSKPVFRLLARRTKDSKRAEEMLEFLAQHDLEAEVKIQDPTVIDRKVTIGEKSVIGPHVSLGEDVSVGRGVRIENSVVFPRAIISDFSSIAGAIIGEAAFIGRWVKIEDECIVGDHTMIQDNVTLTRGVTVFPSKEVTDSVLSPRRVM